MNIHQTYDNPVILITGVMAAGKSTVAELLAQRFPKSGYGGEFTPENFHRLLLDETPRIGLWLDSSGQTPEETVNEIITRTQNGEGLIT